MAVDTCKLEREANFACKVEVTTGTAEALTAAEGAFNAWDPMIEPDIAFLRREGQGTSIDPITGEVGARGAKVGITTEVYGAATVPAWGTLLLGAGAALTSRTYNFVTSTINSNTLTMGYYESGAFKSAAGCKLNWNMKVQNGEMGKNRFEGTGLWQAPTSVAQIAPTYPSTAPPRVVTFTIGGTTYKCSSVELDLGNDIQYREDVSDATGYHSSCIVNRNITLKCDPERLALGTQDWYAAYLAKTTYALVLTFGNVANNVTTITAPKMQLAAPPEGGSRKGIRIDSLTFQMNRSADAGDDALVVAFT